MNVNDCNLSGCREKHLVEKRPIRSFESIWFGRNIKLLYTSWGSNNWHSPWKLSIRTRDMSRRPCVAISTTPIIFQEINQNLPESFSVLICPSTSLGLDWNISGLIVNCPPTLPHSRPRDELKMHIIMFLCWIICVLYEKMVCVWLHLSFPQGLLELCHSDLVPLDFSTLVLLWTLGALEIAGTRGWRENSSWIRLRAQGAPTDQVPMRTQTTVTTTTPLMHLVVFSQTCHIHIYT